MPRVVSGTGANRLSLALGCLLLGVYLLLYVPVPDSADGKAILAVASSLVQHGRTEIDVIGGSDSLLPRLARLGQPGIDGALYAKKGITPSLALLPLTGLAVGLPWLSVRATAMLFNPLVTCLGALALYRLLLTLRFAPRTAFVTSLVYGLCTLATVYVKTLYGEPLTALLLVVGVEAALRWREAEPGRRRDRALLTTSAAFALCVGVNTIYVVLLPIQAVFLFGWRPRRTWIRALVLWAIPLVAIGLLLMVYNAARFGSPTASGYHFEEGEGFIHPLFTGFVALFASPWRGLFYYTPLLLLALPGWNVLRRRDPRIAWLALGLVMAQALAFASWWSWHGGIGWGPRFLLPAIPFMMLALAPLIESTEKRRWLWLPIGALIAVSAATTALGALYSYFPYEIYLARNFPANDIRTLASGLRDEVVWTPALSPLVGHSAMLLAGFPGEPAWLAGRDMIHLMACVPLFVVGGMALALRTMPAPRAMAAFAALLALNVVVMRQNRTTLEAKALAAALDPPGPALVASLSFEDALLDVKSGARIMTMNAPTAPDDPDALRAWNYALGDDRLWFVTWFGPGDPVNWQERWLWENAAFARERSAVDHRALHFDLRPAPEATRSGGWRFGPDGQIALAAYGVTVYPDGLALTLRWETITPPGVDYTWFVHLLGPNGQIVDQQDRAPLGGYAPTSAWEAGHSLTDRLSLAVPAGADIASMALRIGWVGPDGQPLPAFGRDGTLLPERFVRIALEGVR